MEKRPRAKDEPKSASRRHLKIPDHGHPGRLRLASTGGRPTIAAPLVDGRSKRARRPRAVENGASFCRLLFGAPVVSPPRQRASRGNAFAFMMGRAYAEIFSCQIASGR